MTNLSNVTGNAPDADSADESNSDTEAIDPDLNIKVEEMGDSELGLDIKNLMTQPGNGVMLDLQMRKLFDSSTPGDAQGDMPVFLHMRKQRRRSAAR